MKKFKFWKENRNDQEYELTLDEIKAKGKDWAAYVEHESVDSFVAEKEGLNSVCDLDIYQILKDKLKETRWDYIKN